MTALSQRAQRIPDSPIAALMKRALEQPDLISLAAGFVDQASLPVDATRSAALALLADPELARAALQYNATAGSPVLRQQLMNQLHAYDLAAAAEDPAHAPPRARAPVSEDQVVLTVGGNQALQLTAEALLDPGDYVLCDAPTYFVFTGMIESIGARCLGVATDEFGIRLDALEETLERCTARGELARVKAIYVMSYFDNPRGVSLAPERRAAIVALAERYSRTQRIYVIEDAAYRELRYEGGDRSSLFAFDTAGESVIYTTTFSKSFAPGVRVGFGVYPKALARVIVALKANSDFGSPHLNQCLLSQVLSRGLFEPHVALLRELYARKAACMLAALDEHVAPLGQARYLRPRGGLYVWLELPSHIDTGMQGRLFERACELGVLYVPGEFCFPDREQSSRSCMRLSFGVQSEARIAAGIAKLAQAIREIGAKG